MEAQVKLPDMGEGVESATIAAILVSEGDQIEEDQDILELETEKAVAQMPSPKAGKVKEIHVKENQEVSLGDLLLTLDVEGEGEAGEQEAEETQEETAAEESEEAEAEQEAAEESQAETEEAAAAEEAEERRPQQKPAAKQKKAKPDEAGKEGPEAAERRGKPPAAGKRRSDTAPSDIPAAPATRQLARELGVDLRQVEGRGEGGWITASDVKRAAKGTVEAARPEGEGRERDQWGVIRREALPTIRKTIAKRMRASKDTAAHVTHFDDADVTELEAFRREHQDDFEGVEFTPLPFVVRAALDALKDHPLVNAALDLERGEIIYKEYYGIGIAVATDRGLIVPVLRDADGLSIYETAQAIDELAERVRAGDFELKDLKGGTFSVSNLGAIGGRYATPIINYPESAVLLPGRARKMPVVRNDAVEVRLMLPLSLTYDHRLVDGAAAQGFLNDVKAYLEDPGRLLMR